MGLIVVLGVALVGISRQERLHPAAATKSTVHPTLFDHWHEAYGFDICGTFAPNLPKNPNASNAGINTQGDGLINVEPLSSADTGNNATLGRFVKLYPGMALSSTEVQYPGKPAKHDGEACGTKPATVQVKVWNSPTDNTGHLVSGDPTKLKLANGQLITIAFLPAGSSIPKPTKNITTLLEAMSSTGGATTATTSAGSTSSSSLGSTTTTAAPTTTTSASTTTKP